MFENETPKESPETIVFGPFRLDIRARVLQKDGRPLPLGARAFDILCVLVQNAGKLVTKRDLLASVWQDVSVDEGSLRFHISNLRRALGNRGPNGRYVETLAGQGYCFVAPVSPAGTPPAASAQQDFPMASAAPARLTRMIGRDDIVEQISHELMDNRFITLVGPGGIGKTTVAVAVTHKVASRIGDAVCFADLGPLTDPSLVPTVASAAVGLAVQSDDATADLITFLRDKRLLLLLDCCEPVVEAVAALAERLFLETPGVHLLATSREALRVEGEHVIQIPSLRNPPDREQSTLDDVLGFPAAQLFAERVAVSGWRSGFSDADAPVVARICRKLDGIPLAIELAAGLVNAYGVDGTADLLSDRFALLHQGRRTALPRHQTLAATLDWSYELLSSGDREILRQLAVFAGTFTLDAVRGVVRNGDGEATEEILARLIAKSLVTVDTGHRVVRYRLLDTTRAYGLRKLADSGEIEAVARRHAEFFTQFLAQLNFDLKRASDAFAAHGEHLGNVRAALEWAFSEGGDVHIGVTLAAAAAPFYLELSLLTECRYWCARAIVTLDDSTRGGPSEIELQAALGLSVMFTDSNSDEARIALERGVALAEKIGDLPDQLRLLGRLHLFHYRTGDFRAALSFAKRSKVIAERMADPVAIAAAHSLLGISHHLMEDLQKAYEHLDAAMVFQPATRSIDTLHFGVDYRNRAAICMARTLWVLGYPDQAASVARQTVDEAERLDNPLTLCIALIWAVTVFLWIGDWEAADGCIHRLVAHARSRSIIPYPAAGTGVQGYLAIMRGDAQTGIPLIQSSLADLHRHRYELITTALHSALAEGFLLLGAHDRALETIETAFSLVERNGDLFNLPELLRIKGDILASGPRPDYPQAEACYLRSHELAFRQSALSWELRTGISLARLWSGQGRSDEAFRMLDAICARFTEGFDTPDFKNARLMTKQETSVGIKTAAGLQIPASAHPGEKQASRTRRGRLKIPGRNIFNRG
jgi:predicted ATPase/DNA-binding winged helix-turn-helix (wHTH) protein